VFLVKPAPRTWTVSPTTYEFRFWGLDWEQSPSVVKIEPEPARLRGASGPRRVIATRAVAISQERPRAVVRWCVMVGVDACSSGPGIPLRSPGAP
jgi:hypothetical protein